MLADYENLTETKVGHTRGERSIDKIFTNFGRAVKESGTLPPLETDNGVKTSDHRTVYLGADLPGKSRGKKIKYTYRYFDKSLADDFKARIVHQDWSAV